MDKHRTTAIYPLFALIHVKCNGEGGFCYNRQHPARQDLRLHGRRPRIRRQNSSEGFSARVGLLHAIRSAGAGLSCGELTSQRKQKSEKYNIQNPEVFLAAVGKVWYKRDRLASEKAGIKPMRACPNIYRSGYDLSARLLISRTPHPRNRCRSCSDRRPTSRASMGQGNYRPTVEGQGLGTTVWGKKYVCIFLCCLGAVGQNYFQPRAIFQRTVMHRLDHAQSRDLSVLIFKMPKFY